MGVLAALCLREFGQPVQTSLEEAVWYVPCIMFRESLIDQKLDRNQNDEENL